MSHAAHATTVPVTSRAAAPTTLRSRGAGVPGTRSLRLVPANGARPAPSSTGAHEEDADDPPPPADVEALPDPRRWAALLAQAVVEILGGHRPVGQIVRWVDPEIYERVRSSAPAHTRGPSGTPVRVRRVRVSTALDGTVEAAAVVDDGTRCRALAMRFEALARRWQCTALDLV